MMDKLKRSVFEANRRIVEEGLVLLTWGNVSAVDRERGVFVIKPSGVPYDEMTAESMVVVSLKSGAVVEGNLKPSSDTPTHWELYRTWPTIGAIVHTHSLYASSWAQAGRSIPVFGTTHADHFHGPIPVTRELRRKEIDEAYELHTGKVIVKAFRSRDPLHMPAVLVHGHAPFIWGETIDDAVKNAMVLERVARMASETIVINRRARPMRVALLDKHFFRKHGPGAYYGQKKA